MSNIESPEVSFELTTKTGFYEQLRKVSLLSSLQLERSIERLWGICPTPSNLRYPDSYSAAINTWLDIHIENGGKLTQLQKNEYYNLKVVLNEIVELSQSPESSTSTFPDNADRNVLRSYLTDFPLYSSILTICADTDEKRKTWWLWFLFRLTQLNREFDRPTSKTINDCRLNYNISTLIPLQALKHDSNKALAKRCGKISGLRSFRRYFQTPPNKKQYRPYQSDNEHVDTLTLPEKFLAQVYTPTTRDGESLDSHYSFEKILEEGFKKTNFQLSEDEYRRQFQHQRTGMENAIILANLKLPMSNEALTTSEFNSWIKGHISEHFEFVLPQDEISHWFLMFFRMFIGKQAVDFKIYNDGSGTPDTLSDGIHYVLDKEGSCQATLQLSGKLFKGKEPEENIEKYFAAQSRIKVDLPWPISSLFNQLLRNVSSNKRHNITVSDFLSATSRSQDKWLNGLIGQDKDSVPYKLTTSTIHNSFEYFFYQSLPSIVRDYSNQNGSVLMHYVNMEEQSVSELLSASWFDFLNCCDLARDVGWGRDTRKRANKPIATKQNQIGSAITLKHPYLIKLFDYLLKDLGNKKGHAPDLSEKSQRIALYIHIRTSIELGLRPVKDPYPTALDFVPDQGVMVVQDKRVHSKQERRLLTLTPQLSTLINTYQTFCSRVDPSFDRTQQACVSIFDGQKWLPLSPKVIKSSLSELEPGCFRHICASQIVGLAFNQHHRFDQQFLNQKMNHRTRGLDILGQYSLCSIPQIVKHQYATQEILMSESPFSQVRQFWGKVKKWDEVVINAMN